MTLYEEFVMEKVQQGVSVIGLYPLTDSKLTSEFGLWKSKLETPKNE